MKCKLITTPLLSFFSLAMLLYFTAGHAENIDPNNDNSQYAYGDNIGWLNTEPSGDGEDGVDVGCFDLKGYIWGENIGWINLDPGSYGGVSNDGIGNLRGYAWGENVGWINFNPANGGVTIDSNGDFDGWAWGENIGWIHFKNLSIPYKVQTAYGVYEDSDQDGIVDNQDNCLCAPNLEQEDSYPPGGNNCGDACECEGNFDGDEDQDGSDAFAFKEDFGRSPLGNPCESGNPCNGDFDCDNDVDGSDAFTFKEDFGRSSFGNPCPNCVTEPWCSYSTGERFTDNEDGTVTDNNTDLMWTKDVPLTALDAFIWQETFDYVVGMNSGTYENFGYTDWRVPSRDELVSLLDPSQSDPCLPEGHPFTLTLLDWFFVWVWSSTEVDQDTAWVVTFADCGEIQRLKSTSWSLWPVRNP